MNFVRIRSLEIILVWESYFTENDNPTNLGRKKYATYFNWDNYAQQLLSCQECILIFSFQFKLKTYFGIRLLTSHSGQASYLHTLLHLTQAKIQRVKSFSRWLYSFNFFQVQFIIVHYYFFLYCLYENMMLAIFFQPRKLFNFINWETYKVCCNCCFVRLFDECIIWQPKWISTLTILSSFMYQDLF